MSSRFEKEAFLYLFWMKGEMREPAEPKSKAERRLFSAVDGNGVGAATVAEGKEMGCGRQWSRAPKVENFFARPT